MKSLVFVLLGLVPQTIAPSRPAPAVEIVESIPVETILDNPGIRDTREVWLEMIGGARRTLDVEQFYIADEAGRRLEDILAAIVSAAERGVKVRILADAGMSRTYPQSLDQLSERRNIEVRRLDFGALAGGTQHAKYFIVDGREIFVGSQNFDWRALEHIHELGLRLDDRRIASAYGEIFALDWQLAALTPEAVKAFVVPRKRFGSPVRIRDAMGEAAEISPTFSPLGLIPDPARWDERVLVDLIDGARRFLYLQFLSYAAADRQGGAYAVIDEALRRAAQRGVRVRLIVSDWEKGTAHVAALKDLAGRPNLEVAFTAIPDWSGGYIPFTRVEHCKYVVADGRRFWLGTSNCEKGYFYSSRNLGIEGTSRSLAGALAGIFLKSWDGPYRETIDPAGTYPPREHGERKTPSPGDLIFLPIADILGPLGAPWMNPCFNRT